MKNPLKNFKKSVAVFTFGLVLFGSSALPAYAAGNFFQDVTQSIGGTFERLYLLLPGDKSGKIIADQAFLAAKNLKTAQMNTQVTVDLQNDQNTPTSLKFNVAGPIQISNLYDPSTYKQDLKVSGQVNVKDTAMTADADLKMTGEKLYFRINELPPVPFFNLDNLKGKWLFTSVKKTSDTPAPTADEQQKFIDAYQKLLNTATFSSASKQTKNDHEVYVFDVTFSKAALLQYIDDINKVQTDAGKPVADAEEARASFEKLLSNTGDLKLTIWVDRSSFFVRHVELPISYTPEKSAEPSPALTPAEAESNPLSALSHISKVNILVSLDADNFNAPITFTEPTDAQDAQQAFQQAMSAGGLGGGAGFGAGALGTGATGMPTNLPTTPTELPTLTPQQKQQLLRYQQMSGKQLPTLPQ